MVTIPSGRGRAQEGRRPGLIVQNDSGNEMSSTTIVAVLSTGAYGGYPFRCIVSPSESGLRETSTVMLDQLFTVDIEKLGDRVGRISPQVMLEVDSALKLSLSLFD